MKVVSLNGSRRKTGNSQALIDALIDPILSQGAGVEKIFLGDYKISGCTGCEACKDS